MNDSNPPKLGRRFRLRMLLVSALLVAALFLCGCGCEQVNEGVSQSEPAGSVRGTDPTALQVPSAPQPPSTVGELPLGVSGPPQVNGKKLMDDLEVDPNERRALLAEIERLGGRFELDLATRAVTLIFAERAVDDAELSCLKGLGKLQGLILRGFLVTDAGLEHVKGLTHLQTLDLHFTGVTDAGLAHLKDLKDLRRLSLDGSFLVTDGGLSHLKGLASLRELGLTFTRVSDAGVEDLQKTLPDLQIRRRYAHGRAPAGKIDSAQPRPSTSLQGPPDNRDEQRGSRPYCLLGFSIAKGVFDDPDERWTASVKETHAEWIGQVLYLDQKLISQPHDIQAWQLLGWTLSYNLSSELRYHHDRYYWVKQGINVLIEGTKNNPKNPALVSVVGWYVSHKIGRSDEVAEFRRMFVDDTELHTILIAGFHRDDVLGPTGKPDNWLVAKQWFQKATDLVDNEGVTIELEHTMPVIFYSNAPMSQMNYAIALEEEGRFDQASTQAWRVAAEGYDQFGWREIPTAYGFQPDKPNTVRLNDLDKGRNFQKQVEHMVKQLEALAPGLRQEIRKEKEAQLTDEQRKALSIPIAERTDLQKNAAHKAQEQLQVAEEEMARRIIEPEKQASVRQLYTELTRAEEIAAVIGWHRQQVNFDYWRLRAEVEQTEEVMAARRAVYSANQDFNRGNLQAAKENYEKGLAQWHRVLDAFPAIARDEIFRWELVEVIERYRGLLEQCHEPFPKPFILQDVLDLHESRQSADEAEAAALLQELREEF